MQVGCYLIRSNIVIDAIFLYYKLTIDIYIVLYIYEINSTYFNQ